MDIEKSVILRLDTKEVYLLRSLASICDVELNQRIKREDQTTGYSFQEMQELGEFARGLKDL
jgi:hypothetical protein